MSLYDTFRAYLADEAPIALATMISGPSGVGDKMIVHPEGSAEGKLSPPELACLVAGDATRLLREERSDAIEYALQGGTYSVFVDAFPAPLRLVIVGASHAAGPLTRLASAMGYRVTVADARAAFAVPERFPEAEQVLKGWPQDVLPSLRFDESTYVVLLSHDSKFDEPTLRHVVPSRARYIGAIGSRKTQRERFERLRKEGYTDEQLSRVYGPIGLDIGGRTPEETAIAILAEMTAVRYGRPGGFMRDRP
jgi:xanthine dehydrogenase accessory factor